MVFFFNIDQREEITFRERNPGHHLRRGCASMEGPGSRVRFDREGAA
jgi:hypothetical protein